MSSNEKRLADIEQSLKAALLRHAQAASGRDVAAEALSKVTKRRQQLDEERQRLLTRFASGMAARLGELEVEISTADEEIDGHRTALRAAQPAIIEAAAEVTTLSGEGQQALRMAVAPLRTQYLERFEAAAADVASCGLIVAAIETLLTGAAHRIGLRIQHPVTMQDIGDDGRRVSPDIEGLIGPFRGLQRLLREAAAPEVQNQILPVLPRRAG